MTSHEQRKQQQEQRPRRILEKSRTVRRRYQRSNKRLEFTASQIQRIEREEEREKKAQQLREREKRKAANKKKRAEKEAKEREERRRLGLPDPNNFKIPASQPLLVNFFGARSNKAGRKEQEDEAVREADDSKTSEDEDDDRVDEESTGDEGIEDFYVAPVQAATDALQQQASKTQEDVVDTITDEFSDIETELGVDWLDDIELEKPRMLNEISKTEAHKAQLHASKASTPSAAGYGHDRPTVPARSIKVYSTNENSPGDSFEDDTSLLLQSLDPNVLRIFEAPQQQEPILHDHSSKTNIACSSNAARPLQRNREYSNPISTPGAAYGKPTDLLLNAQLGKSVVEPVNRIDLEDKWPSTNSDAERLSTRQSSRGINIESYPETHEQQSTDTATSAKLKASSSRYATHADFSVDPKALASEYASKPQMSLKNSIGYETRDSVTQQTFTDVRCNADDEFDDLPLSTQDMRDLESMIPLG